MNNYNINSLISKFLNPTKYTNFKTDITIMVALNIVETTLNCDHASR